MKFLNDTHIELEFSVMASLPEVDNKFWGF